MQYLLELIRLGGMTTLLDVDNALYMTAAIEPLSKEKQKRAIFWGLVIEFAARILLVLIFGFLASGTEPLFEIFGIEFTAETIALLAAGIFLIIRSTRELFDFFFGSEESEPAKDQAQAPAKSFTRLLAEMTLVNIQLSIDTVIAIVGSAITSGAQFALVLYMLTFSAGVRLLFVQQIAGLIKRYPATNIIILVFLTIIGIELSAQGLGLAVPEMLFNSMMLIALGGALVYQIRFTKSEKAA
jgi:predicted tellurium resistance membrane protein TerC